MPSTVTAAALGLRTCAGWPREVCSSSAPTATLPSAVSIFTGSFPSTYSQREEAFEEQMDFFYVANQELLLGEALAAAEYDVVRFVENPLAGRPNTFQGLVHRSGITTGLPVRAGLLPELDPNDTRYQMVRGLLQYLLMVGESSFFALQWFEDPHAAYVPPKHLLAELSYDRSKLRHPLPYYLGLSHKDKPEVGYRKLQDHQNDLRPYEVELLERLYLKEVESIDERVGYILDLLERQKLAERTFVVFTSDHGEGFGEHGRFLHGNSFYDELVHVPLIIAGPGISRGGRVSEGVSHVDLMPTLCELLPVDCLNEAQGQSFASLLRGEKDSVASRVQYLENPSAKREQVDALVDGDWKLIAHREAARIELYDLAADAAEQEDVSSAHPGRVERMLAKLLRLRAENEARREQNRLLTDDTVLQRAGEDTLELLRTLGYVD